MKQDMRTIRQALIDSEVSISSLSRLLHVSPATVSRWVKGQRVPSLGKADRIAKIFQQQLLLVNGELYLSDFPKKNPRK